MKFALLNGLLMCSSGSQLLDRDWILSLGIAGPDLLRVYLQVRIPGGSPAPARISHDPLRNAHGVPIRQLPARG